MQALAPSSGKVLVAEAREMKPENRPRPARSCKRPRRVPRAKRLWVGFRMDQNSIKGPFWLSSRDNEFEGDTLSPDTTVCVSGPQSPRQQPQEAREAVSHLLRLLGGGADGQHRAGILPLRPRQPRLGCPSSPHLTNARWDLCTVFPPVEGGTP